MEKDKKLKSTNGSSKLIAKYNTIADKNSPEAKKIRKELRDMGLSVRELFQKDSKKSKDSVKAAPLKKSAPKSKKAASSDDGDEG